MKIEFKDNSYIEMTKSLSGDKVFITVAAADGENSRSVIVNSVELEKEQLLLLVKSLH